MDILVSLKENDSIQLKQEVKNWKEAINKLFDPLVKNDSVDKAYPENIISRTEEIGPFYIIAPYLAMPHERSEMGAKKDAFTFMTLKEPIEFPTGEMVDILIGFSATNSEVHIAKAIPQIVCLFEEEESFDLIRNINNKEELFEFIEKTLN